MRENSTPFAKSLRLRTRNAYIALLLNHSEDCEIHKETETYYYVTCVKKDCKKKILSKKTIDLYGLISLFFYQRNKFKTLFE